MTSRCTWPELSAPGEKHESPIHDNRGVDKPRPLTAAPLCVWSLSSGLASPRPDGSITHLSAAGSVSRADGKSWSPCECVWMSVCVCVWGYLVSSHEDSEMTQKGSTLCFLPCCCLMSVFIVLVWCHDCVYCVEWCRCVCVCFCTCVDVWFGEMRWPLFIYLLCIYVCSSRCVYQCVCVCVCGGGGCCLFVYVNKTRLKTM